jgi:hypothetical protein
MGLFRSDVDVAKVKEMLARGIPGEEIARRCSCSYGLVWRIGKGLRKPPSPNTLARLKANKRRKVCTCCGEFPIKHGLKFLCKRCFTGTAREGIQADPSPCHIQI